MKYSQMAQLVKHMVGSLVPIGIKIVSSRKREPQLRKCLYQFNL